MTFDTSFTMITWYIAVGYEIGGNIPDIGDEVIMARDGHNTTATNKCCIYVDNVYPPGIISESGIDYAVGVVYSIVAPRKVVFTTIVSILREEKIVPGRGFINRVNPNNKCYFDLVDSRLHKIVYAAINKLRYGDYMQTFMVNIKEFVRDYSARTHNLRQLSVVHLNDHENNRSDMRQKSPPRTIDNLERRQLSSVN